MTIYVEKQEKENKKINVQKVDIKKQPARKLSFQLIIFRFQD